MAQFKINLSDAPAYPTSLESKHRAVYVATDSTSRLERYRGHVQELLDIVDAMIDTEQGVNPTWWGETSDYHARRITAYNGKDDPEVAAMLADLDDDEIDGLVLMSEKARTEQEWLRSLGLLDE